MDSIFTKIVKGEIPCYKIAEDDKFLAFLDINPVQKGHTLVIPKEEIDYLFDLNDSLLQEMILFAKEVSIKIKNSIDCKRIGMSVIGFDVPHAHIHLIPINNIGDMDFSNANTEVTSIEFKEVLNTILQS